MPAASVAPGRTTAPSARSLALGACTLLVAAAACRARQPTTATATTTPTATRGTAPPRLPEAAPAAPTGDAAHPDVMEATSTAAGAGVPPATHPLPKIDVHMHIGIDAVPRAVQLMDRWGITGGINLSGMYPGPPYEALAQQLEAAASAHGRIAVFANPNFRRVRTDRDYGHAMALDLEESKRQGAIGLKISKGLGLGFPAADGQHLLAVDDPGLDPLFEKAGELGMPVAIHVGDPKAFWRPPTRDNERWDELGAHPEWSFYGKPVPAWQELYAAFERRVARHRRTNFIAVHFGNDPEDPTHVARMLDRYPNFFIDTAARVPEMGRHDARAMRRFFEKYQDRILFGTDTGVGASQEEMMYGSTGATAPTEADEERFFRSTWRYFETADRQFESPTPIQGRWKIDGIGLPEPILRKIYFDNAARLLHWRPAAGTAPSPSVVPGGKPARRSRPENPAPHP